jgi:hypothetical protein
MQGATEEMIAFLKQLRGTIHIGMVGGSDLVKQREQLGEGGACAARVCARMAAE